MSDTGFTVPVDFEGNADELAAQLAAAIIRGVGKGIGEIQGDLAKMFSSSQARRGTAQASQGADRLAAGWLQVTRNINQANAAFRTFNRTMGTVRTPDDSLREYIRLLAAAERAQDELREERDRAVEDDAFGRQIRTEARLRQQAATTEARIAQSLTGVVRTELSKQAEAARVTMQGTTTRARAEASERIVLAQQEGARVVAETRSAGQRRVEVMRFVFNQIRALERGLGAIFRGTANVLGATTRGIGASLNRMGGLFRRADRELSSGIGPALGRREGLLRSSMNRQERIIQSSVNTQSLQIQRLEKRLSTGVLGAVSGRSGLGALLGGGLAIGGGFALVSRIRTLATASADFEQSLSVLQAQLGVTDRRMQSVRDTAIRLGNDLTLPGVSAKDAGEAIGILSKQFAGMGKAAVPAAQQAAKGVLQLSRAAKVGAEEAAGVVGAAVNVFGISADRAVAVADQVAGALTQAAGVGFQDFALAFKQGASVFEQFQGPALGAEETLTEFNTALAVMARNALVGSDAGTSLKQFFLQATRNAAPAKKAIGEVADRAGVMGSVFFDQAGQARPLTQALDILRKGLKGMTTEQRNSTLATIFGSDALRAANSLLKVSSPEYEKIRRRIQQQGLAAKIAAAQNTGMRGALDALNSVIETQALLIGEKLNVALGNATLAFTEFLNKVLSGGGIFAVFRQAVIGATTALAGFLALRGAVEIFRLLGVAARGLLTPFGILGLVITGLGAAFNLLRQNSPAFNRALEQVGTILSDFVGPAIAFVQEQFENFVEFIGARIGDINSIGRVIGDFLVSSVQRGVDLLQTHVIPRIKAFVEFLRDVFTGSDFGDAFAQAITGTDTRTIGEKIGDKIRDIFAVVRRAIGNAQELLGDLIFGTDFGDALAESVAGADTRSKFERIGGRIRDGVGVVINAARRALDELRGLFTNFNLGSAARIGGVVASAFAGFAVGGPIGAAVAGSAAAIALLFGDSLGAGLVDSLSKLGGMVRDALAGPMQSAIEFVTGFFTADRLIGITTGFLDVLEQVAFTIGNIVTDPRVLGAVAALGALGATMAFRLAQGFIRGVIDNFGEIFDIVINELGFEGEFDALGRSLGNALVVGLLAVFVGGKLLGGLTAAASRLGLATGKTFSSALQQGVTTFTATGLGSGPKGLLQGLLGGPGMERAIQRDLGRVRGTIETEIRRMQTAIRGAGRLDLLANVAPDAAGLGTVRENFRQLEDSIGTARVAGVRFREAIGALGRAAVLRDIRGVGQAFGDVRASMVGQGRNIGVLAGTAIASSLGVAFGAQMAIEGQGMGDVIIGLGTIFASAAASFAVGGPILGGITLGLGAITSVFQANQAAAENAKREVHEYRDALVETSAIARRQALKDTIFANFQDETLEAKEALGDIGFEIDAFAEELLKGEGAGRRFFAGLIEGIGPQGAAFADFLERGVVSLSDLETGLANNDGAIAILVQELERAGVSGDQLGAILDFLNDESGEFADAAAHAGAELGVLDQGARNLATGLGDAKDQMGLAFGVRPTDNVSPVINGLMTRIDTGKEKTIDFQEEIDRLFGKALPSTLQSAMDDLVIGIQNLPGQLRGVRLDTALGQAQVRDAASDKAGEFLAAMNQGIEDGEITTLPQIRANRELFIEQVRAAFTLPSSGGGRAITSVEAEVLAQINTIIDEATTTREFRRALRQIRLGGTIRPPVDVIPRLLVKVGREGGDLMTQIKEAVTGRRRGGPQGFAGGGGAQSIDVDIEINPQVTVAGGSQTDIGSGITEQIRAGVERGGPRISAALNSAIGRALRSGSQLAGSFASAGVGATVAFAQGVVSASGRAQQAAVAVGVTATQGAAAGSVGMVVAGAAAAGQYASGVLSGTGGASGAGSALASSAQGGASGGSLYGEGQNVAFSFVGGILSGVGSAYSAGYALGAAAAQGTRDALQAQSPSKVFRDIGRDVGAGLALGLRDSKTDITSAVNQAISDAIETARRALGDTVIRAEAGAGLFETLLPSSIPGGPTAVDVHQARLEALDAIRRIGDSIREARQTNLAIERAIKDQERSLVDALRQVRENLTEAISRAFGAGARGLDVARQRVNLGGLRGQVGAGISDILSSAIARADELRKRAADTSLSDAERARAREALRAQEDRIRSLRQQIKTLNINTTAGRAAANVILDFGQQIRDLGSSMLASGASAQNVSQTMARYRDQLIAAALAQGVSRERLRELIQQLGLTDAQLRKFVNTSENAADNARARERELRERTRERIADLRADILANVNASRSLSSATEAGRQNRRVFIDAFQNIRRFGVELLRSGTSAQDAVAQMRALRNNLVSNARAMGFNSGEIQELLRMLGLTDAQLAEFVAQLGDLNDELERGRQNLPEGGSGPFIPTGSNVFNINLPFGDPEAVAFTVANRIAFAGAG